MKPPFYFIVFIVLFISNFASAQDAGNLKVMPFAMDQLYAKPFEKYDTLATPDAPCTPAANDNYANATTLTIGAAAITGRSCGSLQAGEALGCNNFATQTVWYRVTATAATTYIIIDATGANCYAGAVIWPATGLPTSNCKMIDCQSAVNGPSLNVFELSGTVGTQYAIQVSYLPGVFCGKEAAFTIRAANSYGATINNPVAVNTCSTAYNGCYFTSTPTAAQVNSTCAGYPITTQPNLVHTSYYKFTTASANSSVLLFQDLLFTSCSSGNVSWFTYKLFDQYCNVINCGNLGNLQNNVACNQPYVLEYKWEQVPSCSYSQHKPYQYVPTGTIGCGTPLPIELLTFEAQLKNNKSQISWATAKEVNNDYFVIERSTGNQLFEPIGKINSKGNSNALTHYYFEDILPGNGRFYYRLKQVDINGDYKYSEIIAITSLSESASLSIKNPVNDHIDLTLESEFSGPATISIINSQGVVCLTIPLNLSKGMNKKTYALNGLKPGIYTLIVNSEFFTCHQKLVKV